MKHDKNFNVGVLGATGTVGQRILNMLDRHPWFKVVALMASSESAGKPYREAANWQLDQPMPEWAADMIVKPCLPETGIDLVLSALDRAAAGDIELEFAAAGMAVISNAMNHRMRNDVPLVIPEVNPDHLEAIRIQRERRGWDHGCIVTNPNCSTVGLVSALKPLHDAFGVEKVLVTTMQAISGAGYPGVPSLDILDNVIPLIKGEEEKIESETLKLLGAWSDGGFRNAETAVSAHCNRVHVRDGHLECVSVKLRKPATPAELIGCWRSFMPEIAKLALPSVPDRFIEYRDEADRPQPRRDRQAGNGMTLSIGRLRACPILDWKFVVLSHNTIRGAAGAAVANAELLVAKGWL
jgi:aspartate-semialdehyde dehydrogenase